MYPGDHRDNSFLVVLHDDLRGLAVFGYVSWSPDNMVEALLEVPFLSGKPAVDTYVLAGYPARVVTYQ